MDIYLKSPEFSGQKTIIFLVVAGVLLIGMPILGLSIQKIVADQPTEDTLSQNGLALVQGNTLIPISNPTNLASEAVARKVKVMVTAYSSSPEETDDTPFTTAAGTQVREGIVANNLLPFGTKVRMPELYGNKVFVVEDRMHSRKSDYQIDIWLPSYGEALNFGAKSTYIEILES